MKRAPSDPVTVRCESTDEPSSSDLAAIDEELERHNYSSAPLNGVRQLAALARDGRGRLRGGAVGRTWGRCCELLQLWVDSQYRGLGIGSRLLDVFEAHARTRGCTVFYLTTLSYQAPEFYRAKGYETLAEIDGYPNGIVKYLMCKKED
jgi:ribosomal protein S18 acetylase RimI-like enzyme